MRPRVINDEAHHAGRVAADSTLRGVAKADIEKATRWVDIADLIRSPRVVGGVAVGIRSGVPRATLDTDVAVRSTVERSAIREALTGAGLDMTGTFAHSLKFRHRSGEPVQIVLDPEFDPMIDRAEPLEVAGVRIRVVTTADLIAMKERAAADPARRRSKALRDQSDVALLPRSQRRVVAPSAHSMQLRLPKP